MLRPRLMPCLLIHNQGLVKTKRFADPKYVGDPINAVRIFNEKAVDELMVLDIDATSQGHDPDCRVIANLANECRMPMCYGGGVRTVEQVERIIGLGVEKVALSHAALTNPGLIDEAARRVGSQSVVVVLDIRTSGLLRRREIVTHNARRKSGVDIVEFTREVTARGAGEIIVNSVDRDGEMNGYDLDLVSKIRGNTTLPITVLGGAGSVEHIVELWRSHGIIGAAAGSFFVFQGKYRAVLISYPSADEKRGMLAQAGWNL